jgi:hypothetical protein
MEKIEEQKATKEPSGCNQSFSIKDDNLYRLEGEVEFLISNFHLQIRSQEVFHDEDMPAGRWYEMVFKSRKKEIPFLIPSEDFLTRRLQTKIAEIAGSSAILWGSLNELQIATQELSGEVAEKIVRSRGLTPEGSYVCENLIISPSGIIRTNTGVVPGSGIYSKNLGFLAPDQSMPTELGRHIVADFLALKSHTITFPLIGHTALAPFASAIRKSW